MGLFLDAWGCSTRVVSTAGDVVFADGRADGGSGDEFFLALVLGRPRKLDSDTSVLLLLSGVVTPMAIVSEDE